MEYRDACLNKMVTYILLQYGVPLDKMENIAKSYQTDLECVLIDIPVADNVFEDALYNIWLDEGVIDKLLDKLTPHEREVYNYLY